jgi:hypothetical protein
MAPLRHRVTLQTNGVSSTCRHTTIVSGIFKIHNPQKKSQKKNTNIKSAPKPAKQTAPSSVSRKAITFTNLKNSLNRESKD